MKKLSEPNKINNYLTFGVDVDNLEIHLFDEINYETAYNFIKGLNLLVSNSKEKQGYKQIIIHLSTPGGDEIPGMAIYDAIKGIPNKTTIVVSGEACSMGSIILQAGNRRVMKPSSLFMFHEGNLELAGTRKQIRSGMAIDKLYDDLMLEIYSSRMRLTGKFKNNSKTKIKQWLKQQMDKKEDVYFIASQAVSLGLADEVFTSWRNIRK